MRFTYADHEQFDLTAVSFGAGVQSTTLALLAAEGILPKPDIAIFSDTHWEPKRVYDHLHRVSREVLEPAGIELVMVSNGDIVQESLSPNYPFARLPVFIRDPRNPKDTGGTMRRQCTPHYKIAPIQREIRRRLGGKVVERDCKPCEGRGERQAPWMLRYATGDATEVPALPCSVCHGTGKVTRVGQPPRGRRVLEWVGFSTDEAGRAASSRVGYAVLTEPLLDLGMSREDCIRFLADRGWGETPKSACVGCPFHNDTMWHEMREQRPEEWRAAVAFDEAVRENVPGDRKAYLHSSMVPLRSAVLRPKTDQLSMLDALAAEEGLLGSGSLGLSRTGGGCSPYGCVSDEPYDLDGDPNDDHVDEAP